MFLKHSNFKLIFENSFYTSHENLFKNLEESMKNKTFEPSINDLK